MAYKIALTSTGPMSGKSTLADYLRDHHGFIVASHSNTIVQGYVDTWNSTHISTLNVPYVYAHKEAFRQDLQTWGNVSGFNNPEKCVLWVRKTLEEWSQEPDRNVVFAETRGEGQSQVLRDMGFTIVQLVISERERERRAIALGKDYKQVYANMMADPYLELGIKSPDITLDATLPTEVQAKIILDRPEKTIGYHIFGSTVHPR